MPNRILRDWTDSYHIERLSPEAERLFIRIIMKADDYGRFHGDPRLIRSACFPLLASVTDSHVDAWMKECLEAGCLIKYQVKGRRYLAVVEFKQRLRNEASKFPSPEGFDPEWLPTYDCQATVNCQPNDSPLTARATNTPSPPSLIASTTPNGSSCKGKAKIANEALTQSKEILCSMFVRELEAPWSYIEESTLCALIRERPGFEGELIELRAAQARNGRYFPRKLERLLTDWTATLDSVRNPNYGRLDGKPDHRAEKVAREYPQVIKAKILDFTKDEQRNTTGTAGSAAPN